MKKLSQYLTDAQIGRDELIYHPIYDAFQDPDNDNWYEIEFLDAPEDITENELETEDDTLPEDYLDYDEDDNVFIDESSGKSFDLDVDVDIDDDGAIDIIDEDYDELDDDNFGINAYKRNMRRRRPQRGLSKIRSKRYYKKNKARIKRKHKLYRVKNRRHIKTRMKRIHHPTSRGNYGKIRVGQIRGDQIK